MYISTLYDKKKNIEKISQVANNILYYYIKNPVASTYSVHRSLVTEYKELNKTINYKNVHLRVQQLHKNGLIEKIIEANNKNNIHGAINYRISSFGIFYVILNNLHRYDKNLIIEHTGNPFFNYFLFQYFEIETIKQVNDDKFVELIFDYLKECAVKLDKFLVNTIEIQKQGGIYRHVDYTAPIFKQSKSNFLEKFVKQVIGNKWLDSKEQINIEIIERDRKAKVSDGVNELIFEITQDNKKASLSFNNRKFTELYLIPVDKGDGYRICSIMPINIEERLDYCRFIDTGCEENREKISKDSEIITSELIHLCPNSIVIKLVYSIIQEIWDFRSVKTTDNSMRWERNDENLDILSRDRKFSKLIKKVRLAFDKKISRFTKV